MAINPRKIKKKVPAKDLRSNDPKSLRNKALREANRAANENKPRYQQKIGPTQPQGPEKPNYKQKIGPSDKPLYDKKIGPSDKPLYDKKIGPKKPSVGSRLTRGFLKKVPVIGTAIGFIVDASPAGTGSTVSGQAQKAVEKKMKREIRQGPELAVTGVKVGSYRNYGEKIGPKKPKTSVIMPKASMAFGGVNNPSSKSSTYSGYGDFKTPKVQSSASNTAATTAAASVSGGGSQAANVANAGSKAKAKVGRQTRYQRNELAMEQRKRSSSGQRKSILSLFRKG